MRDLPDLAVGGLVWGAGISLLVASVGGLEAWRAHRRLPRLAHTSAGTPINVDSRRSRRALRFAFALAAAHTLIVGVVGLALLAGFDSMPVLFLLDLPLASGYRVIARPLSLPLGPLRNLASYLFLGGLFHFGVGWLIAHSAALADASATDDRPPEHGQQGKPNGS